MENPNLSYINQLADGDKEFEQQFITILKEELPKERELYLKSIAEGDFEEAGQLVHKLKHKFNILSMEDAYRITLAFEDGLKVGNTDRASDFLKELNTMNEFLNNI